MDLPFFFFPPPSALDDLAAFLVVAFSLGIVTDVDWRVAVDGRGQ